MTQEQTARVERIKAGNCKGATVADLDGDELDDLLAALLDQPARKVSTDANAALSFLRLVLMAWTEFTCTRTGQTWTATLINRRPNDRRGGIPTVVGSGASFCVATSRACVLALVKLGN